MYLFFAVIFPYGHAQHTHETEKTIHLDPMLNTEQFKCLKTAAGKSTNVFSLNF